MKRYRKNYRRYLYDVFFSTTKWQNYTSFLFDCNAHKQVDFTSNDTSAWSLLCTPVDLM